MNIFDNQVIIAIARILGALILCLLVLSLFSLTSVYLQNLANPFLSNIWIVESVSFITSMIVLILIMLALSKGRISAYGFKMAKNMPMKQIISLGLIIGIAATILGYLIELEQIPVVQEFSFIQIVIFIWIFASIFEEVLTRGLVLSFLEPLTKHGFYLFTLRISLPVLISAIIFGLMHMSLFGMGMGIHSVLYIASFAFILGMTAGYYREKTGSLIPAIMIHMLANIGGTCIDYFFEMF